MDNPFKKTIWEMYYYDDTNIRGKGISRFDTITKPQKLSIGDNIIEILFTG